MSEPGKSQGGGNLKYVIGGLLLLVAAVAVVISLRPSDAPAPPPEPKAAPAPAAAERVNPMAQPDLILDEPKDAGQPAAQAAATDSPDKKAGRPREARDEWDCDGDLPRAALENVINSNRAQVRNCYERRLKVNNVLQGDLSLKLKVGSNGQIAAASVGGSLHDKEVFGCVRTLAQRWSFPPPTNGSCAVVQVPFQFSPKAN
ncbi:MAG: AgmX/PglI C-terminal domain-containing protein [Polyangiales bacterium]